MLEKVGINSHQYNNRLQLNLDFVSSLWPGQQNVMEICKFQTNKGTIYTKTTLKKIKKQQNLKAFQYI